MCVCVCVCVCNGILFSHQKYEILPFAMTYWRVYDAERNKLVGERQIPYDFTHMWNLRKKTSKHWGKRKRQTKKEILGYRELMVTRREAGGGTGLNG